jgi:hypothetical protein
VTSRQNGSVGSKLPPRPARWCRSRAAFRPAPQGDWPARGSRRAEGTSTGSAAGLEKFRLIPRETAVAAYGRRRPFTECDRLTPPRIRRGRHGPRPRTVIPNGAGYPLPVPHEYSARDQYLWRSTEDGTGRVRRVSCRRPGRAWDALSAGNPRRVGTHRSFTPRHAPAGSHKPVPALSPRRHRPVRPPVRAVEYLSGTRGCQPLSPGHPPGFPPGLFPVCAGHRPAARKRSQRLRESAPRRPGKARTAVPGISPGTRAATHLYSCLSFGSRPASPNGSHPAAPRAGRKPVSIPAREPIVKIARRTVGVIHGGAR